MRVMDKLPKAARGSFVWTLLQGRALETVEHLTEDEYQKEGGDEIIFDLLDKRWPQRDTHDEMGEIIAEVFAMTGKDGESLRQWAARAREVFDRCSRKCGVKFPEEVRGWVLLNRSGLSEGERAVVLARAQGNLKFDELARSMRSCYPDMTLSRKRHVAAAHAVDDVGYDVLDEPTSAFDPSAEFEDVELLLAEHGLGHEEAPQDEWEEHEAAEILAASWKDKRSELNRLQKGRKFQQANDLRRAFRVEVEEVRKRSKCFKCHKYGHFARECKNRPASTSSQAGQSASSQREHGAGTVTHMPDEHFICSAGIEDNEKIHPVMLVSSPGLAVLDSGCGKTIVGSDTLQEFHRIWEKCNVTAPQETQETNVFKYGNGEKEVSNRMIDMPVIIGGRRGIVRAAVVKGAAPLLLSRSALKSLRANMDFFTDELRLFGSEKVPVSVNAAGQYTIDVSSFPGLSPVKSPSAVPQSDVAATAADDVDNHVPVDSHAAAQTSCAQQSGPSVKFNFKRDKAKDFWEIRVKDRLAIRHHRKPRYARFTPCHTQCPVPIDCLLPHRCTEVIPQDEKNSYHICDQWTNPRDAHAYESKTPWKGSTTFAIEPTADLSSLAVSDSEHEVHLMQWSPKQHRQLMTQIRQGSEDLTKRRVDVIEVFSPPRFALECSKIGWSCVSADLCTGWDFRKAADRQAMRQLIQDKRPRLLTLSPPCTWAGGWFHLNKLRMSPEDAQEKVVLTRLFVNFCKQLIELQLQQGGRVMFEHPKDSVAWTLLRELESKLYAVDVHMCRYGLRLPGSSLIRKPTRLLVSHADMRTLNRECPGKSDPRHHDHAVIAGSHPKVGSISKFAGQYPAAFVKAVLRTVTELPAVDQLVVHDDQSDECLAAARAEDLQDEDDEKLKTSLKKLHQNLGHPPNSHLIRILKHGGASTKALQLAKAFACEQCDAQAQPKSALPAQTHRVIVFNAQVGIDVKYLDGWHVNQKVPALNIIDYASSLQMVVPLFKKETSESIRHAFMERWVSWAGMPAEVICDPAKPNIADALTVPLEQRGSAIKITAAEAHWQLGKVEVHGGWFNRILRKVLSENSPQNQNEWLECVHAAHCKNQLIQVYGMTPSQFVFGSNPRIPENLLDEPLEVIPATASLYQDAVARQVKIRQSARRAVLDLQDSKSLRLALAARPRVNHVVSPGQYVAYWRSQKWVLGKLHNQGAWYGPAVVLGHVGRNVVIIHKRQIFRCAPEQVRPSTESEKQLAETPELELTGIKHLIDQGSLSSKQFVDLVPESYPTEAAENPEEANRAIEPVAEPSPNLNQQRSDGSNPGVETEPVAPAMAPGESTDSQHDIPMEHEDNQEGSYGPVRRRVAGKHGPMTLYRPGRLSQDDFSDMMQEIVPKLVDQMLSQPSSTHPDASSSGSRAAPVKRSNDAVDGDIEPGTVKSQRTSSPSQENRNDDDEELMVANNDEGHTFAKDEIAILSVQRQTGSPVETLLAHEKQELLSKWQQGVPTEVLLAEYLQKKASKEIRCTGNPPELQTKVDEAKLLEWNTIMAKNAARVVYGQEAERVRRTMSNRIMGSRYM